jgi:hypothetical protein
MAQEPDLIKFRAFLYDTLALTKSIVLHLPTEAQKYNDYLTLLNPNYSVPDDTQQWRYYKNINEELFTSPIPNHFANKVVSITSLDDGTNFTLTRSNLIFHPYTRNELLKFGSYYDETIKKYPNEELYIKSVISDKIDTLPVTDTTPKLKIVRINKALIEQQEDNIVSQLQDWIDNYQVTWFFEQYALSDGLFTAAQLTELYYAIFRKIIAIRLQNAKTIKAHSFHIETYLASILKLDEQFYALNFKQKMYFYRNILYLNNHVGSNQTFDRLIDILFNERKISIQAIDYRAQNKFVGYDRQYSFNKRPLNKTNIVYDYKDLNLDELSKLEYPLAPSNINHWKTYFDNISEKLKYSLHEILYTKDLSSIFYNYTDNVRYALFDTIVNTWLYLNKTNRAKFLILVFNKGTNNYTNLTNTDALKLFIYALYKRNHITLNTFPEVSISHVLREPFFSTDDMLSTAYIHKYYYRTFIDYIKTYAPTYINVNNREFFYQYTLSVYLYNIALYLIESNESDVNDHAHYRNFIAQLFKDEVYTFDTESTSDFLNRINFSNINDYSDDDLENLIGKIVDTVYDNHYFDFLNFANIQKGIIDVFKKLTSYTIQITDSYVHKNPLLTGANDRRYALQSSSDSSQNVIDLLMYNCEEIIQSSSHYNSLSDMDVNIVETHLYETAGEDFIDSSINVQADTTDYAYIYINQSFNVEMDVNDWIGSPSSQDDLKFNALNPIL